jgi:hypothetical protein
MAFDGLVVTAGTALGHGGRSLAEIGDQRHHRVAVRPGVVARRIEATPEDGHAAMIGPEVRALELRPTRLPWTILSIAVFALPVAFMALIPDPLEQPFGVDFQLYRDVTQRWLAGGPYIEPYQLAGPYEIRAGDVLYPPVGLWLFVPFAVVPAPLAAALWWAVPLGLTGWAIRRLRPRPSAWPLIALCVAWPTTLLKTWTGNPVVWAMAAVALGTLYAWPSVFALLKPSLFPFALFGARHRSWWRALGVLVLLSLPFGALWMEWWTALANSRGGGPLYSALEIPMLLLPIIAWATRRSPAPYEGSGQAATVPAPEAGRLGQAVADGLDGERRSRQEVVR